MTDDFFRYVLPYPDADNKDIVFFPYWRFKGMLFFCGPSGVKERFIDVSHQAIASPFFPISVGLRSQAMKLRFAAADAGGRFLRPQRPFEKIADTFEQRFGKSLPKPILHKAHIGETLSLIYAPFYVKDRLYDAILDTPVTTKLPAEFDIESFNVDRPRRHIQFVATLCPNCGWDLQGKRDTLVLSCKNCNSSWYPVGEKLKSLKFARIARQNDHTVYLPFWRIRPHISGITLDTYADLIKIANLPKVVQSEWNKAPFRFWIPAFKVRPRVFLRAANHITLSQPDQRLIAELPDNRFYPTTLPIEDAVETLMITLAEFMKPRTTLLDRLPNIRIKAKSFTLVYLPFNDDHHEFIQPDYHLAINKSVMALSTNL
jgi:hypothetical protein